ncbi:hypothetical protein ACFV9C_38000 [Kribbella sp. NPDC059898]|uniref:hypothetical protein n=1 Tax=Kribbella sp. NPDC059898 TaxID=3346995 RepID=UPI00365F1F19
MIALLASVFTVLLGSAVAVWRERTVRRRLDRDRKLEVYGEVHDAAAEIWRVRVWPAVPGDLEQLYSGFRLYVNRAAFVVAPQVAEDLVQLSGAVKQHLALVAEIRVTSSPGRQDAVDVRFREAFDGSRKSLAARMDRFVVAARGELEVSGRYVPVRAGDDAVGSL